MMNFILRGEQMKKRFIIAVFKEEFNLGSSVESGPYPSNITSLETDSLKSEEYILAIPEPIE